MKVQMPASNTMPNFFAVETLQNRRKVSLEPVLKVSTFMSYVRNGIFMGNLSFAILKCEALF